jgi:hypothetical protein
MLSCRIGQWANEQLGLETHNLGTRRRRPYAVIVLLSGWCPICLSSLLRLGFRKVAVELVPDTLRTLAYALPRAVPCKLPSMTRLTPPQLSLRLLSRLCRLLYVTNHDALRDGYISTCHMSESIRLFCPCLQSPLVPLRRGNPHRPSAPLLGRTPPAQPSTSSTPLSPTHTRPLPMLTRVPVPRVGGICRP